MFQHFSHREEALTKAPLEEWLQTPHPPEITQGMCGLFSGWGMHSNKLPPAFTAQSRPSVEQAGTRGSYKRNRTAAQWPLQNTNTASRSGDLIWFCSIVAVKLSLLFFRGEFQDKCNLEEQPCSDPQGSRHPCPSQLQSPPSLDPWQQQGEFRVSRVLGRNHKGQPQIWALTIREHGLSESFP